MLLSKVKADIVARMSELIAAAETIQAQVRTKTIPQIRSITGDPKIERTYPEDAARIWQHNFGSLIVQVIDGNSVHWAEASRVIGAGNLEYAVDRGRLLLIALNDDLQRGLLDRLVHRAQAEVTADYLGMAEGLLGEGVRGSHDHVPAAVLAGAVLERGLRDLCARQQPPVPTTRPDGSPKTMDPLISDLATAGAFDGVQAKQLRAWAGIRNAAAHGDFTKFDRAQVEQMVVGIGQFLAKHA